MDCYRWHLQNSGSFLNCPLTAKLLCILQRWNIVPIGRQQVSINRFNSNIIRNINLESNKRRMATMSPDPHKEFKCGQGKVFGAINHSCAKKIPSPWIISGAFAGEGIDSPLFFTIRQHCVMPERPGQYVEADPQRLALQPQSG